MTIACTAQQDIADEIAAFDRLSGAGRHAGLSEREYAQFFRQIGLLAQDRRARILDLGCGDGVMACKIAQEGFTKVTGIDISPGNIALARRRAEQAGVNVDFRAADIADLGWMGSGSYDIALVSGVLHHFPTEQAKSAVTTQVQRILSDGGLFAGIEPNRWHPYWYLPILMMKLTWSRLPISFRYVKCHCTKNEQNQSSPQELDRIFRGVGMTPITFEPFLYVKPEAHEDRYHEGIAAIYRDVLERFFCRLMPEPHNTSYFVFKAVKRPHRPWTSYTAN